MAKKKTNPDEISAPAAPPARRRAPARKKIAAVPDPNGNGKTQPSRAGSADGNGKTQPSRAEIAEAAYFRHLNRAGAPGDEFSDWVEAERELRERQHRHTQ